MAEVTPNAETRVLPADHECTVVECNTAVGIWRCSCGRAYRFAASVRTPEHDYDPLVIDGEADG